MRKQLFEFVTEHNLVVVALVVLVTAGLGAGIPQMEFGSGVGGDEIGKDTQTVQKAEYVQSAYLNATGGENAAGSEEPTTAVVYLRDDGAALSEESLVATLTYQQRVLDNESVVAALDGRRPAGVANLVGQRLAGEGTTLAEQLAAVRAASPEEIDRALRRSLTAESPALSFLSADYEPGTTQADTHRTVFRFTGDDATTSEATRALYEATEDGTAAPTLFTIGDHAAADAPSRIVQLLFLVVPFSLTAILVVLVFVYRDLVDVLVGFAGIVVALIWMFGALGWLGVSAYLSVLIAPVLIVGLGVDYGLHVFMRYREERGASEGVRAPMARSTAALASALVVVTLTAVIGFSANATTSLASIRRLALGISLGVIGTFVVSITLVPALKVTIDSGLGRFGFERRQTPLGDSRLLAPVLTAGARLARRAAPFVLVVGLVVGAAGAVAWTDLDRKTFETNDGDVADWKTELPEPVGYTEPAYLRNWEFVDERYRAADADERTRAPILVEADGGDAATPAVLESVQTIHDRAPDRAATFSRDGETPVVSPVALMQRVAATDEGFAKQLAAADTDDDGVPERNVAGVYDALYETAPDRASRVIDRTPDGDYRSVVAYVPIDAGVETADQGATTQALADTAETSGTVVTATGVGAINATVVDVIAASLVRTMLVGLAGISLLLAVVYRIETGSATLGLVTAVPILLVTALVIGGMWLLDVPLTANTALLLSIVIGLGIDYNVHVSDRFAQELERGRGRQAALETATTGTGGALLGSTLTTVASFSALLIAPFAFFQNFGALVVLALTTSFVVAVFLLPSLLTLWHRHGPVSTDDETETVAAPSDD